MAVGHRESALAGVSLFSFSRQKLLAVPRDLLDQFLAVQDHGLIGIALKELALDAIHLWSEDVQGVPGLEDHAGQRKKALVGIVSVGQVVVAHFIDIDARVPLPELLR